MVSAWPEPPNVKSAGAPYGVQVTFADSGITRRPTPRQISSPLRPVPTIGPRAATTKVSHLPHCDYFRQRGQSGSGREVWSYLDLVSNTRILGVARVMRRVNLRTTTCAAVFATLLALIGQVAAQEATEETTGALPQETSTPPMEEGGAAVDQAAAGSGILVTKRPVEVLAGPSSSASVLYGFPAGRPFRLIGRDAGFAQIQDLESSATGWIDETALAQSSPSEAASAPSAATTSTKQDAGPLAPKQSSVQKPGPANGGQGPLSGFLGGLFGTR